MEARNSDHEICRSSSSSSSSSSCSSPTSMSNLGNNSGNNNDGSESNSRRYGINIAATNLIHSPLTAFLEYSGILGGGGFNGSNNEETEEFESNPFEDSTDSAHHQEVTIRIIGSDSNSSATNGEGQPDGDVEGNSAYTDNADVATGMSNNDSSSPSSSSSSSYQRYDIQNIARWIEQILPFSLLLLLVFIRQHLQGFCVALWISAVLFKSNDIVKKQTALKGERKNSVLFCITTVFVLHVMIIYWWHINDDLLYPLVLLPPKTMPSFWNAVFIIVMNDVMARQMSMAFKCIILMYYKNSKGHNFRKQGQMLTLVEYLLLLYRVLLPTPVWYRFFLNKEYGSLFSSLITGLYLTFKLTSVLGKAQLFFTALRALSRKDMHYGSHATFEQVNAAGDLCAICQEKMHVPILLRCKHIFCEDCVSEWFERERTCPLCRALVKPADIRSYSDGSTNLLFQLF